jgi:RNA polymerase sigma-70 factor, ECF subfamily
MVAMPDATGLSDSDDEVLMARFVAGDHEAFEVLYDRYATTVLTFCSRLLGDRDLADDAFQDTFMTLVDQRFRYRDQGRLRGWLFTIARNVCRDRLRVADRQKTLLSIGDDRSRPAFVDMERDMASREELQRVLATVPPDQREILLLHKHAGFPFAEIARMLASTEAAVKQKAHRATLAIRAAAARDRTATKNLGAPS